MHAKYLDDDQLYADVEYKGSDIGDTLAAVLPDTYYKEQCPTKYTASLNVEDPALRGMIHYNVIYNVLTMSNGTKQSTIQPNITQNVTHCLTTRQRMNLIINKGKHELAMYQHYVS